ncbi:hypothetical protein AK830_g12166 [Neonectria ditissima]|uniref:F-box domain-containing protein n=1 Tax=Neonectria ditissima TaxID=78410 RepID=A0A0P7AZN7_9HYPO|nr:hypothetical protein AK830_g12166 [Neonectria ditissima]
MSLTDLPFTIFLDIVLLLDPVDNLRCRQVSSGLRRTLSRPDLAISLILGHFPRSREARILRRWLAGRGNPPDVRNLEDTDWATVYARLGRRYFHLAAARPWIVTKVLTLNTETAPFWGVAPWNRFLKLGDRSAEFQSWDPVWTFAPDDGLLIYPSKSPRPSTELPIYRARDLETGGEFLVPFNASGKVIRRVRLHDNVLIFEWCEAHASHPVSITETLRRHYATAYDVLRHGPATLLPRRDAVEPLRRVWSFARRAEWELPHLGMPLSHQDRFFSAHNRTHYAAYIWQPSRSPWGEDDPLERLIVWELGPAPVGGAPVRQAPPGTRGPARVILRLGNAELGTWGVDQRDTPSLRGVALDATTWDRERQVACGHVYVVEETHRWAAGPHSSLAPPRLHRVCTAGIPLLGSGPKTLDECDPGGSALGSSRASCWNHPTDNAGEITPNRAPCWRHDDFPFVTVSEVHDVAAGVRISARQCFKLRSLSVHIPEYLRDPVASNSGQRRGWDVTRADFLNLLEWSDVELEDLEATHKRVDGPAREDQVQFPDRLWDDLLSKRFICGNERWVVGEDTKGDITIAWF